MALSTSSVTGLSSTALLSLISSGQITVLQVAQQTLAKIKQRDPTIKGWAYINDELVLASAKALDELPKDQRGPLFGLPVGIKDIMYTKDMPTEHNSPLYKESFPAVDSAPVMILRAAGALIIGKTTTTEFASMTSGIFTVNAVNTDYSPGGSSSGSAAVVADYQVPLSLGTQTIGSVIRPAAFNGIYGLKPTWGQISREGVKLSSLTLDTVGFFARSIDDLKLVAEVFDLEDVRPPPPLTGKIRIGVCKSVQWDQYATEDTKSALNYASKTLSSKPNFEVIPFELPAAFDKAYDHLHTVLRTESRSNFFPDYVRDAANVNSTFEGFIKNTTQISRKQYLSALDSLASLRPELDALLLDHNMDALLTPSTAGIPPLSKDDYTGDPRFCGMWTALHVPVVNLPIYRTPQEGLPLGLTLVKGRFGDLELLDVVKEVMECFEDVKVGNC